MTSIDTFPHRLDRTLLISADTDVVFRFFTDSARWAIWWGAGSTIDARPGGRLLIRFPNGIEVSGRVIEVAAPRRIVFSYGYENGVPIPAEGSRVTIRLEEDGASTRLHLTHEFADASARDEHIQGWRYQLSVFGNVVADEVFAAVADVVDAWLGAWFDPDASNRTAVLSRLATTDVRVRDRFSAIEGLTDLLAHLDASQRFMPGLRLEREGAVRQCQGTVLADWVLRARDRAERARGTTVFVFGATGGRVESVTGFWNS